MMNAKRAQEIANSPVMADVTYNGERIYIQEVDEQNNTATIYALENPNKRQTVSVESLVENS